MRVPTSMPAMQYNMQESQSTLSTALQQVSTGLRVNQLSDDPSASASMVSSLANSAAVDQYTKNVSSLQPQMETADSALSSVITALNSAVTTGTSGANGTVNSTNRQAMATSVQGVLSGVIANANTSFGGVYLFGGSASSTPPFVAASTTYTSAQGSVATPLAPTTHLTSGSVTRVSDAATGQTMTYKAAPGDTIATLAAAITSAVSAGTLSAGTTATINAAGELAIGPNTAGGGVVVTSTDAVLGSMSATPGTAVPNSYAYVGNSTVNSVKVGDSLSVQTNVPGDQIFTSGSNVIGSLKALIKALQTGSGTQVGTATAAVTSALNYVGQQRISLDNGISQMDAQESYLSQETVSLTSRQTALVGISLATAATNLSQAEQDNSAVLAAAAKVLPQTLLQYLQ